MNYSGTSSSSDSINENTISGFSKVIIFNAIVIVFSFGIRDLFQIIFDNIFVNSKSTNKLVAYIIYNIVIFILLILMYSVVIKKK